MGDIISMAMISTQCQETRFCSTIFFFESDIYMSPTCHSDAISFWPNSIMIMTLIMITIIAIMMIKVLVLGKPCIASKLYLLTGTGACRLLLYYSHSLAKRQRLVNPRWKYSHFLSRFPGLVGKNTPQISRSLKQASKSPLLALCEGNPPVDSPHKEPVTLKEFHSMTSSCVIACSAPSDYVNRYWHIVKWALSSKRDTGTKKKIFL